MFTKVLIANRGEIACRIQRTCKRMGIATVAVYSDADADAPHAKGADEAVNIGPPAVAESYLNIDAIIAAAKKTGAQAVHPGYGLLSENPKFSRALKEAGLTFVGPPAEVLESFGDKLQARTVAKSAGVSPPPGSEGPLDPSDEAGLRAEAERVGYPLLVKAAAGGGGIGMQVVKKEAKLQRAVSSCADRGSSSFGDARVYLERYIQSPKHIEVQILCDRHGNAVALGERECSMQRRHQKIIEEAPSAAPFFAGEAGEQRRQELHASAIAIAKKAAYEGAGTVEFVASAEGELFFLEVNARLQVEHGVSELVTRVDLVEQQLRIAAGEALAAEVLNAKVSGHAIEARIYAEDPAKRFAPQPGSVSALKWPAEEGGIRVDSGIVEGQEITPYYDPLMAKLLAFGETREEAITRLDAALESTTLELQGAAGPGKTNIPFCRQLITSAPFRDGSYNTLYAEALAKGKV